MHGVNRVILVGRLGRDPDLRFTANGSPITTTTLATTDRFRNKDHEWQEHTEWHRLNFVGKRAELAKSLLTKGRQLYVEGTIYHNRYQDKLGIERTTLEIIVRKFLLLGDEPFPEKPDGRRDNELLQELEEIYNNIPF